MRPTEYVALTPSGEVMNWTRSKSPRHARRKVTRYWRLAQEAGYRVVRA